MSEARRYKDRSDAGRRLARELTAYEGRDDVLVLGLPRGGIPVAYEVARALDAPMDAFLVRKLGVPGHEELAMGAIAAGGIRLVNEAVTSDLEIQDDAIARVAADEQEVLERGERLYRGERKDPAVEGRTVIVVDDGLATGATMQAALLALRARDPAALVVAVPVAARPTCDALRDDADEVICSLVPESFQAVSKWYDDFAPPTDDEVRALLDRAARERPADGSRAHRDRPEAAGRS